MRCSGGLWRTARWGDGECAAGSLDRAWDGAPAAAPPEPAHRVRAQLKEAYGTLQAATRAGAAPDEQEPALRADLVFGLIEGVILVSRNGRWPRSRRRRRMRRCLPGIVGA